MQFSYLHFQSPCAYQCQWHCIDHNTPANTLINVRCSSSQHALPVSKKGNGFCRKDNSCVQWYTHIYIYIVFMWQMSVLSHESAQRKDAGHLIDENIFKTIRPFCYQWFRVSTRQRQRHTADAVPNHCSFQAWSRMYCVWHSIQYQFTTTWQHPQRWAKTGTRGILLQPSLQYVHGGQRSSFGGTSVEVVHELLSENSCLHWQPSTSCTT